MDGIATGLSNVICKDGQTTITANIPFSSFKITGLGAGSAAGDSANLGQVQAQAYIWCGTAGGTKNALTLTPSPAITAYAAGQCFRFISGATASDDAVTIAVSGLAPQTAQNDGAALSSTDTIAAGKMYEAIYDGTAFQIQRVFLAAGTTTANTFTKTQTWTKGTDVASAAALTLGDGNYFDITGTTAITSIGTKGVGTVIKLHFDGALTLTHHATDLILPGGANITTAAGDEAEFVEYATGDWRCVGYPPTWLAATQTEQETGTATNRVVTPGRQHFHQSALKVWGKAGVAGDLAAGYNVDSITDDGTGLATVVIADDFSSANYSVVATTRDNTGLKMSISAQAAGSFQVVATNNSGTNTDPSVGYHFMAAGDL